jgi:hypothetical protein
VTRIGLYGAIHGPLAALGARIDDDSPQELCLRARLLCQRLVMLHHARPLCLTVARSHRRQDVCALLE